jgi:NADH-ubiquinone oxidoreductase chain 6
MKTFFINILAFGTLFSSLFSIVSTNPVISVIFLISTFVQAALYLILIGIHFVGISYIVIYVGAIAVLFLFVIMMINIKLTDILETGNEYTKNLPLGLAIGLLFIFIIISIIPFNFNNVPAIYIFLDILTYLNSMFSNSNIISGDFINYIGNNNFVSSFSDILITDFKQIEILGHGLYTYEAILLIILSVILLLAMVAIIIISKQI